MLTTAKFSVEDYHRMVQAGILNQRHVELLNGEIVEMVPEGIPHADLSDEAAHYLRRLLGDRAKIRDSKPITLANSEPEPDLCICKNRRYSDRHPYPADIFWVVEYSDSSLLTDRTVKASIYATAGIIEYWIIDLPHQTVWVYKTPDRGEYLVQQGYKDGEISPKAFPDLVVSIPNLLGLPGTPGI